MYEPFVYLSTYTVRPGHLDEALEACREVAGLVESREPRMLVFQFFADEQGRQITVLQVHPDAESMANHMALVSEHLARSGSWIESFSNTTVLGQPPTVLSQWYQEAGEDLTEFPRHVAGVIRVASPVG
ncbi:MULTISPECIES: hypothetical protein [unclassified Arthrobacter]|uniref:hypothetical protein n=1 Tax=unclassified Arthrobacter TaxID=235627 RepID=UPI001C85D389|nr:hypothetical protein [Arthrobacter sp. MAHUQ-56]MBX7442240.1 hypothetical protein [Arthrobacter sp. MAHUQ-56]